jgi:hypothetical protein
MPAKKKVPVNRPDTRTAKEDRPDRGESRAEARPVRNARSIGEFRDILGLRNRDPDKRYRWVKSTKEFDKRIFDALRSGWSFVDASQEKSLIPGEYAVGKGNGVDGSFYRIPAGRATPDQWLYLMWMSEDDAAYVDKLKSDAVLEQETQMKRGNLGTGDDNQGMYGDVTIGWESARKRSR